MNRHSIILALALVAAPVTLSAQPATGLPAFGSFASGTFDTVNTGNLNVYFQIPIVNKAGRGLPFTYSLAYNSSVWYPSVGVWTPAANWGWTAATSVALAGYVSYNTSPQNCMGTPFNIYAGWMYHDPYGVSHSFGNGYVVSNGSLPSGCPTTTTLTNVAATDGSGYLIGNITGPGTLPSYSGLVSANGKQISAPLQAQSGAASLTDRNGNIISVTTGTGPSFTDTLGDVALTVSGSGTPSSPTVLSYTNPSSTSSSYKVNYTAYTVQTVFGCSGVTEYGATSQNLVSSITLPDLTSYSFTYEGTSGHSPNVTGRLASVTLPTGGTISYAYTAGSSGHITCADGTAATLSRTTPDSPTAWSYAHAESGCASGSTWCTTVTDPSGNQTVISFQPAAPSGGLTNGYEVKRIANQGASTVLQTVDTCYNGQAPPCPTVAIGALPPTEITTSVTPGGYTLQAHKVTTYNAYALPLDIYEYDYGNGQAGNLLRKTVIAYDTALTNNIVNMPTSVSVYNGTSALIAQTKYSYDQTGVATTSGTPQHTSVSGSRGNATTVQYLTSGSTYLTQTYSYFDTGNVDVLADVNDGQVNGAVTTHAQTTYTYGNCGNSFATLINEPQLLSRTYAWNCTGAVATSLSDENSQLWSTNYTGSGADPNYWRPHSTADPASATTNLCYWPDGPSACTTHSGLFGSESTLNFNGATSTADTLTALDSQGRTHVTQRRQTQGGTNYDSVETDYDAEGRPYQVTVPYTGTAGCSYKTAPTYTSPPNTTPPLTTTTYDALGRPLTVIDGGGGKTTYTYLQTPGSTQVGFDVLVAVGATSGQTFKRQLEYDGLGRLTSVCEVTAGTGSASCLQSVSGTGYLTKYTYDVLNDLLTVKQNAQGGTSQTRTYAYDGLGRMTSEQNPETNQIASTYTFDTETTSCNTTYKGDLVKRIDPQGTVTCYAYDGLHRLTGATYPSGGYSSVTPPKYYVYDGATVNGATMNFAKGRLAEAYTGASKTTDLGFSYSNRGEVAGVYQASPHSGGYYHIAATYWAPQGLLDVLTPNMGSNIPNWTYTPDGEGRVSTVSSSIVTQQNPVAATSYNGFSEPTAVTFGSADSDAFQYDPNTGRMTQYKANVGSAAMTGTPTWNPNWTLGTLAITDTLNSKDTQTCTYAYDDEARLTSAGCGSVWSQTFTYDSFGNIAKTGSQSFGPTYSATTNRFTAIGSVTPTYDSNGNLTYDGFYNYTWDGEGNLATLGGNPEVYDALNRRVEQSTGGTYTEIVYGPAGNKLALMSGQTVSKVFAPLSAGATAVYTSAGLSYYRHPDWLGSSRIASTTTRTLYYGGAYAPFGENYAETGTTDRNFTGQSQDLTPGATAPLYDFMFREYQPTQGRWISPDPAGVAAADPTNAQSWNRYGYVLNNPLRYVDPSGLDYCAPGAAFYDGAGNVVGYDDSQCVTDQQYGDGSAYADYIYVSLTENTQVATSFVPVDTSNDFGDGVSYGSDAGTLYGASVFNVAQGNRPAACKGVTPAAFDYTTPQTYMGDNGKPITQSAQRHITQGHIYPGAAGNTMYIITPWPGISGAFEQVKTYNAFTFNFGQSSQQGPAGNISFTLNFPVIINPSNGLPAVIGADLYDPTDVTPLNTNKLVLANNCKLVRTSFPIF